MPTFKLVVKGALLVIGLLVAIPMMLIVAGGGPNTFHGLAAWLLLAGITYRSLTWIWRR